MDSEQKTESEREAEEQPWDNIPPDQHGDFDCEDSFSPADIDEINR